ncbi:MAG: hypothetical protein LUP91_10715 [Methylococcaceae bacterium]|nr:hypothetical protein [Methylococcaceae bacterium]
MNIKSMLQIKNGLAVISAKDMAILVGRKQLSILRAIDLIPEQYLRNEMFFMIDDEVFISANGVLMLDISRRHLLMRQRIMMALSRLDDDYKAMYWREFYAAMPPKIIIKLLIFLGDIGANSLALLLFRTICWIKGYSPKERLNVAKNAITKIPSNPKTTITKHRQYQ